MKLCPRCDRVLVPEDIEEGSDEEPCACSHVDEADVEFWEEVLP